MPWRKCAQGEGGFCTLGEGLRLHVSLLSSSLLLPLLRPRLPPETLLYLLEALLDWALHKSMAASSMCAPIPVHQET